MQNIFYMNESSAIAIGDCFPGSIIKVTFLEQVAFFEYQPEPRLNRGEYWCSFMSSIEPTIVVEPTDALFVVADTVTISAPIKNSHIPFIQSTAVNCILAPGYGVVNCLYGRYTSYPFISSIPSSTDEIFIRLGSSTKIELAQKSKDCHVKKLKYSDLEKQFAFLIDNINSLIDGNPPSHFLIAGPPGCGKTFSVGKAAAISSLPLMKFSVSEADDVILTIRSIFDDAISCAPSVIFIDEIDSITSSDSSTTITTLLASLMQKASDKHVLVVGATNRPGAIISTMRSSPYFESEHLIGQLDSDARISILKQFLNINLEWDQITPFITSFSPADLAFLVKQTMLSNKTVDEHTLISIAKTITPSSLRSEMSFIEHTGISFTDICGYVDIKKSLKLILDGKMKSSGVLLYGAPGNSKTMFAKALSTEAQWPFFSISGSEVSSIYVGETEKRINQIFSLAIESAPAIIFLDEFEVLCPRSTNSAVANRTLSTIELCIERAVDAGCFIIGATNFATNVSRGMLRPGRLERHIFVGPPNAEARQHILEKILKSKSENADFSEMSIVLDRYTGAECVAVAMQTLKLAMAADRTFWIAEDFSNSISMIQPRTNSNIKWDSIN